MLLGGGYLSSSVAAEIPAGTTLEIRLRQAVSSYRAKEKQPVRGVLIAPVQGEQGVLLPAGTEVLGAIAEVRRVGIALVHDRARLRFTFDQLVLPDGRKFPIETRLVDVDNAREKVQRDGSIQGIRSKESFSDRASGTLLTVSTFDPLLMIFVFSGTSLLLRFPDAEICYPAGTEIELQLTQPIEADTPSFPLIPTLTHSPEQKDGLTRLVGGLPFRSRTLTKNLPADVTNLIFLGSEDQIAKGFRAAGWWPAERRNPQSEYKTFLAFAQDRSYAEAPMSVLTLDEQPPDLSYQKTLNTFAKRHHLRIWRLAESWGGQLVWTAAATHDVEITFSARRKHFVHSIDPEIDRERAKIVNDLTFTGCVDAVEMVDRPRVPSQARNATGDSFLTDGRIAVVRLTSCDHPRPASESAVETPERERPGSLRRGSRQFCLTVRDELLRNNVGMQAYHGLRLLQKAAARKPSPRALENHGTAGLQRDKPA